MTMFVAADSSTLMRQAPMTAHDYLLAAVHDIDEILGKGYAKAHPELLGAYIQTCALDFGAAVIARAIENAVDTSNLECGLTAIADSIGGQKP